MLQKNVQVNRKILANPTIHYTYTIHCTVYGMHYTLYTIQRAVCTIHYYTLYSVQYAIYTMHYTLYTIHRAVCTALSTVHRTVYTIQNTLPSIHYLVRGRKAKKSSIREKIGNKPIPSPMCP